MLRRFRYGKKRICRTCSEEIKGVQRRYMSTRKFKPALRFLGTGNAFSKHPNNAYFMPDEETIVFIDMDARNLARAQNVIRRKMPKRIYVLVTHLHNDHVSGIPTLAEWLHFRCREYTDSLYICAPEKMLVILARELFEHRNISDNMVALVTAESICREEKNDKWLLMVIPTEHVGYHFENLCFGYLLSIGYLRVLYSGDTRTLEPFLNVSCDEFYCDMSDYGGADRPHLFWDEDKDALIRKSQDCDVYLMHMGKETRERLAEEISASGLMIARA